MNFKALCMYPINEALCCNESLASDLLYSPRDYAQRDAFQEQWFSFLTLRENDSIIFLTFQWFHAFQF